VMNIKEVQMIKGMISVNSLAGMFPEADITSEGAGPYWKLAEVTLKNGSKVTVGAVGASRVDINEKSEVIAIKFIGEIDG